MPNQLFSLSNMLSIIRAPLALLFLQENSFLRLLAIILAMITDSIDGFVARKRNTVSKFGAMLDPAMDKFFVLFALCVFYYEGSLSFLSIFMLLSRDWALCIFALYLTLTKGWKEYKIRAIRLGKITTALQFIVLIALTFHFILPFYYYFLFVLLGCLALIELFFTKNRIPTTKF